MKALIILFVFTNPAWAECDPDQRTFVACSFPNGKYVEVCLADEYIQYRYGRLGQSPELHLALPYGDRAELVEWPGIGRTIWEAVRLTNEDIVYEVYGGFDKVEAVEWDPETEISPVFGGIYIEDLRGDVLAHLECIPGTVDYAF